MSTLAMPNKQQRTLTARGLVKLGILNRRRVPLPAILGLDQVAEDLRMQKRFFFKSPLISQRLSILRNMVGGRSQVIVVMGERGSGKSTLMTQFIASAGKSYKTGRMRLKSRGKSDQSPWRTLNNRMICLSRVKGKPSVIIDDAHQLTGAELRTLIKSTFTGDGERRFQNIVLFAEPALRRHFADIAHWLPSRSVIDKIYMTPLTEKQTMAYLRHRLKAAGMLRKNPFSGDQMRRIYQLSGGLPGWINGEAFMLLKKIGGAPRKLRPSRMGPALRALRWQFSWMEKLPGFSRY